MSFFDVRKWYSFVTLQPPPPAHEVRLQRERRGVRDNYRAPPGYVDIAPTCDSRWEWDRSLRERPRKPSLRHASSERALADDSSSQPATPRSYLRKASDRAPAVEESPAGTDVLSSSFEAATPRSEGSRKDYSPRPRVSLDDSVLYERISRVIDAEDLKDFSQQVKQEPSPPAEGTVRGQTVAGRTEPLQQPPAGNTAEKAEDAGYESFPGHSDVPPRSSGRWGAKLFGQPRKSAIYQQVKKGKKGNLVKYGQDEPLDTLPAESQQNEQRPLSGDLGPPVPVKAWELGRSLEGEEKSSGTSSTESKGISSVPSWRLEPPAALGDDQSKQSTLTHVSSLSTEESSAKQQLPSEFEEAPRRSGKWGRKIFDRLKSKQRSGGDEEQKEKHFASDYENPVVAAGNSSHLLACDAEASRDEVAMKINAQVESDKAKSNRKVEDSAATVRKEDIATPGDNTHTLLATRGKDKSVQERDMPPGLHSAVEIPDIVHDFPPRTADKTNELALLMQERGTEPVGPEKVPFSPPAQPPPEPFFEEVNEPKSPSKSPGKKKGSFFKLPSLKKKKKLSASNIEEPPPSPPPPNPESVEPEESLSFDEILAELRKQHSKQLSPASLDHRSPPHSSLKKVPPPVPPKTWKTTANLAMESQEIEDVDSAEGTEPIHPLPPLAAENIPVCEVVVPLPKVVPPTEAFSPECTVRVQEATADAAESLPLSFRSFFDQEHEVTVLQKASEDALSSSPTEWSYAAFLRGYSQDFVDSCPRRRHNLRLLASDGMGSGDASPTITEARNIRLTESLKWEATPDLLSNSSSPVKPVDVPLPITSPPAPDVQQEYFLYRPDVESTGVSRTKLSVFKSRETKEDEFEDSCREVVTAACERFESSTDVSRASAAPEDFSLAQSLPHSSDRRLGGTDPAAFTMGTSQEFGEPTVTKERRFSFKMSSLRKKKVDKPTKKPDSHEQPRILASLRLENKPKPPVDKGSMMDAYLRSLETQPRSQPHNRSDDSLDLSFVS